MLLACAYNIQDVQQLVQATRNNLCIIKLQTAEPTTQAAKHRASMYNEVELAK